MAFNGDKPNAVAAHPALRGEGRNHVAKHGEATATSRRLSRDEIDALAESIGTRSIVDWVLDLFSKGWAAVADTVYAVMLLVGTCVMIARALRTGDVAHLWDEPEIPIVVGAIGLWWLGSRIARRMRRGR
jgi:hypothetical protein